MRETDQQYLALWAGRQVSGGNVLICRPKTPADSADLVALCAACMPIAALNLPDLARQQAQLQRSAHDGAHPDASHMIVTNHGAFVAHVMMAWGGGTSLLVDIAVVPERRGRGIGALMLDLWLEQVDRRKATAHLSVLHGNPAQAMYARRGFQISGDPFSASLAMYRPAARG